MIFFYHICIFPNILSSICKFICFFIDASNNHILCSCLFWEAMLLLVFLGWRQTINTWWEVKWNSWASPATATHLPSAHAQPLRTIRTIRKNIFQRILLRFGCDLTRRFRSDLKRCAQSGRKACIRFPSDISVLFWRVGSGLIWTSVRQPLSGFTGLRPFEFPISASFRFWIVLALAISRLVLLRKNLKVRA